MRKRRNTNFIMSILVLLMIIIFLGTIYFALDVFGIIKVPAKYSIASLFYSRIEIIASGANTIDNTIIKKEPHRKIKVQNKTEDSNSGDVQNPLDSMYQDSTEIQENSDFQNSIDTSKFYYNQLDEYGKILYSELYNNIDSLKNGKFEIQYGKRFNDLLNQENGEQILNNALDGAVNSLVLDNPELFYIDITRMFLLTKMTTRVFSTTYEVSISGNGKLYLADGFNNESEVIKAIDEVRQIKDRIIQDSAGEDTIGKIKLAHDYLIDTVEYDKYAGESIYDIYGTLVNRRAVCEGYAKTFKYIMDDLEIPCIIVCGTATNSAGLTESHAWNYVEIDGNWYAIDSTWDDPVIRGEFSGELPDYIKYAYFLTGSEQFFQSHVEDEQLLGEVNLTYPNLSGTNY